MTISSSGNCLAGRKKVDEWNVRISKSKFVAGVQCLKRLYLQVHQPELAAEPDAADEAIIEQGQEVGLLAHQVFPGGVVVDGSGGRDDAIRTPRELIANRDVPASELTPTLCEGTGVVCVGVEGGKNESGGSG